METKLDCYRATDLVGVVRYNIAGKVYEERENGDLEYLFTEGEDDDDKFVVVVVHNNAFDTKVSASWETWDGRTGVDHGFNTFAEIRRHYRTKFGADSVEIIRGDDLG